MCAKCVKYIKSNVKHSYYKLPQKQYFTSNICKQKSPNTHKSDNLLTLKIFKMGVNAFGTRYQPRQSKPTIANLSMRLL